MSTWKKVETHSVNLDEIHMNHMLYFSISICAVFQIRLSTILTQWPLLQYKKEELNCAPLSTNLFLFCNERDFMLSLSDNNQTDVIEPFNSTWLT